MIVEAWRASTETMSPAAIEPWIPREQPSAPDPVKPVYAGMGQTTKYEVDVPAVSTVNPVQVTEAFDEPLTKKEVLAIVDPFLRG